ncbi:MAG: hypothetical protein OXG98_13650 [Gemmatimonadetes bacterium]|nr:hypothetical protein [Gemmatimonadota bacterium]
MTRHPLIAICAVFLFGAAAACGNGGEQSESDTRSPMPPGEPPPPATVPAVAERPDAPADAPAPVYTQEETTTGEAAGVGWTVPARWEVQPPRMMRMATYLIPRAEGDDEPGECAVFFFGQGQGGSVDLNLQRWRDQFETESGGTPTPAQRKSTINGLTVTTVSLAGTYLASMGPMFQSGAVKKPGYKMLGAIIEAPEGNVFVKLTGPEKTVLGAEGEFQSFLNSLRK